MSSFYFRDFTWSCCNYSTVEFKTNARSPCKPRSFILNEAYPLQLYSLCQWLIPRITYSATPRTWLGNSLETSITICVLYVGSHPALTSLILKIAAKMYAEIVEHLQQMMRLNHESRNYTLGLFQYTLHKYPEFRIIVTCMGVTIDGVWICNRIYWTP
jgi:hypothetical protein